MNYITRKVQQTGRLVDQITPTSVSNMFETVADDFQVAGICKRSGILWRMT